MRSNLWEKKGQANYEKKQSAKPVIKPGVAASATTRHHVGFPHGATSAPPWRHSKKGKQITRKTVGETHQQASHRHISNISARHYPMSGSRVAPHQPSQMPHQRPQGATSAPNPAATSTPTRLPRWHVQRHVASHVCVHAKDSSCCSSSSLSLPWQRMQQELGFLSGAGAHPVFLLFSAGRLCRGICEEEQQFRASV